MCPIHHGNKGEVVAQMGNGRHGQKVGLLKMDFLGLSNLTILAQAVENIKKHQDIDVDMHEDPAQ